jgi:nitrite reductase/ring-hydroxylating ferredoxin subunit
MQNLCPTDAFSTIKRYKFGRISSTADEDSSMKRRSFFKRSLRGLYLAFGALLGVSGVAVWLELWGRKTHKKWFQTVAKLRELAVGTPKEVTLLDAPPSTDAPAERIGQAWLIRRDENAVEAYTATCPHEGGKIMLKGGQFVCGRHGAVFDLACRRVPAKEGQRPNPAPRDMDPLNVQMVADAATNDLLVQVEYQAYVSGKPSRIVQESD